ncbi:MAG: S-layer family protein, partial [Methylotenera sp.]|nr:S-layer family protein [Methylotenera sp.]
KTMFKHKKQSLQLQIERRSRQSGYHPALTQKRLGDGFYEQRLIREQIGQLTGRRFLTGYASDEAQYQALMMNGVTFAQAHQLVPGVALSAAQIAQLTSDIVWLVEQTVNQSRLTPLILTPLILRAGNFGVDEMNRKLNENGVINAAIGSETMLGSPVNAQDTSNTVNTITSGNGSVYQATHQGDFVGTIPGNNPPTGGAGGSFPQTHTEYTGDFPPVDSKSRRDTDKIWGEGQYSQPKKVDPTNIIGAPK